MAADRSHSRLVLAFGRTNTDATAGGDDELAIGQLSDRRLSHRLVANGAFYEIRGADAADSATEPAHGLAEESAGKDCRDDSEACDVSEISSGHHKQACGFCRDCNEAKLAGRERGNGIGRHNRLHAAGDPMAEGGNQQCDGRPRQREFHERG